MFAEKVGVRSNLHYLEVGWPGADSRVALCRSEKAGLGFPSNCFRGGQGSFARGKAPSQATGIAPTHSGAHNAGQLSPAPHQKARFLFFPLALEQALESAWVSALPPD